MGNREDGWGGGRDKGSVGRDKGRGRRVKGSEGWGRGKLRMG